MSDLDFAGLRSYVESQTYLPEFGEVERRARRHRRRRRAATALTSASVLLIFLPASVVGTAMIAGRYPAPDSDVIGLAGRTDGPLGTLNTPDAAIAATPPDVTLVAADGIDLSHLYGLVDVCDGKRCDLQLVAITPAAGVQRIGMLRDQPTDTIVNPRLVALDANTVVVSAGVGGDKTRQSITLTLPAPSIAAPTYTDRPVQTSPYGPIQVVRAKQPSATNITRQPPVSQPTLALTGHGWWVTGTDPLTGMLDVSVSRDAGRTWPTESIGVLADRAAVASTDGTHAYMLVRSAGQMLLCRSTDGGHAWQEPTPLTDWPTATDFGIYLSRDGRLTVWLVTTAGTTYLSSTDGGISFVPAVGPVAAPGPVVALSNGYLTLGGRPAISTDGNSWSSPYVPYLDSRP
jgi:hypothetical protein